MITEFLPSDEKAMVQLKLLIFKMGSSLDNQIKDFMELIEIFETPTLQAYSFLFISVLQYLKEKLSELFPESDPNSDVFKRAQKHGIVEKWAKGR